MNDSEHDLDFNIQIQDNAPPKIISNVVPDPVIVAQQSPS